MLLQLDIGGTDGLWDNPAFHSMGTGVLVRKLRNRGVQLTLKPLTWKICWASNNSSRWQMGFNSEFKGL